MNRLKILKEDGHLIPVILKVPEEADSVVIMVHGFTSSKECPTGQLLLRRMPEADFIFCSSGNVYEKTEVSGISDRIMK